MKSDTPQVAYIHEKTLLYGDLSSKKDKKIFTKKNINNK